MKTIAVLTLVATIAEAEPTNNCLQFGFSGSNYGIGFTAKYLRKIFPIPEFYPVYIGGEIRSEEKLDFAKTNFSEGKHTFRIPIGILGVEDYYYLGFESGVSFTTFDLHGELISSDCQGGFSCEFEYKRFQKSGIGIPLEGDFGLKFKNVGIGVAYGYDINSYSSSSYYQFKLFVGI